MGGRFLSEKTVKFGLPFLLMVVGGSFGLREFAQLRYDYRSQKRITKEKAESMGINMKPSNEVTLEKIYEDIEALDIDTWENKRGPRPWEEDNKLYQEALQRAGAIKSNR